MLRPDFDELANSFIDEATFAAIDCQKLPETAKDAGVTQYPTFSVLHEVRACSYADSCVELMLTHHVCIMGVSYLREVCRVRLWVTQRLVWPARKPSSS